MPGTPDHASTKTKIDHDVIVQLSSSSPAASSKRSLKYSFSNPNFAKLRVLSLQLCQVLGQLRNSPLCMPPRTARRQGSAPVSCHGGHFLLQWLRAKQRLLERTSTGSGEPSSKCHPVHCAKMSQRLVVAQPGSKKHSISLVRT